MKKLLIGVLVLGSFSTFANVGDCDKSISKLVDMSKSLQVSELLKDQYSRMRFKTSRDMDSYSGYIEDVDAKSQRLEILKQNVRNDCAL